MAVKKVLDASDAHYKELQRKVRFARMAKLWISLMAITLLVVGGLGNYAWNERGKAIEARRDAENEKDKAIEARRDAETERGKAIEAQLAEAKARRGAERRAAVTKGRYESLQTEQEQVRNERAALQEKLAALESQEEQTRAVSEKLEATTRARLATLEATIENLQGQLKAVSGETEQVRAERLALQKRLASLQEELAKDTTAELQAKMQARIDSLEATIATLEAELEQATKDPAVSSPAVADLKPGETFNECADCPEMVVIPAGNFLMGSPDSDKLRDDDEAPQHTVTIPRPFALGKHEVTFDEYDTFALATGGDVPDDQGWERGERPVINVSWDDAQAYVAWLSERTGRPYRLPSEAEWEFAARAGTTGRYSWGDEASHEFANYGEDKCCGGVAEGRDRWINTAPVGSFKASAFSLHDMHGNVWEWVEDCYNDTYAGAPGNGDAWTTRDCSERVLRGGSWFDLPGCVRAAYRYWDRSDRRLIIGGFRVARTLP